MLTPQLAEDRNELIRSRSHPRTSSHLTLARKIPNATTADSSVILIESVTRFARKDVNRARADKIISLDQLSNYNFIILAVDNNKVRNIVYNSGIPFLDLRANGKTIMAYLTQKDDQEYLELTQDDGSKGGCQREDDIEERHIQFGNKIIAEIGIQFLADYLRGETKQKKLILTL